MKNKKKGFTLIEVLGVIALLAVISSVGIVTYSNYKERVEKKANDISIKSIITSTLSYYNENKLEKISSDGEYNYYCITINQLINTGYLKENDIKNVKGIATSNYVKLTENINNKTIDKKEIVGDSNDICVAASDIKLGEVSPIYTNGFRVKIEEGNDAIDYKCEYKQKSETDYNGKGMKEKVGNDVYCVFNGLTSKTWYDYKVSKTMNVGTEKVYRESIGDVETKELPEVKFIQESYFLNGEKIGNSEGYTGYKKIKISYDKANLKESDSSLKMTPSKNVKKSNDNTTINAGTSVDFKTSVTTNISLQIDKNNTKITTILSDGTNSQTYESTIDNIDETKPVINKIEQLEDNASGTAREIKVYYNDTETGVSKIYISETNSLTNANWTSVSNQEYYSISKEYGTYYIWIMDGAGNISTVKSVEVVSNDTTPPKISYIIDKSTCNYTGTSGTDCWTRNNKKVTVKISDNVSLKSYKVRDTNNKTIIANETFTDKTKEYEFIVYLGNSNYVIEAYDTTDNYSSKTIHYSYLQVDNEPPVVVVDTSVGDYAYIECSSEWMEYGFQISWYDLGVGEVTSYTQAIGQSRNTPPSSGWKSFSSNIASQIEINSNNYLWIKIKDAVGNTGYYRIASNYCDVGYGDDSGSSGSSNDCQIVCQMDKMADAWHDTDSDLYKMQDHAVNAILAGDLSFTVTYNGKRGIWYKGSTELFTWYSNNCSGTTCTTPRYSDLAKKSYSAYHESGNYCNEISSSYTSGVCSDGFCYCCNIGYGFYNGSCMGKR